MVHVLCQVVGIIDYMRQYDIIKRMERMGKSVSMIAGQAEPTIVQPSLYKTRFQQVRIEGSRRERNMPYCTLDNFFCATRGGSFESGRLETEGEPKRAEERCFQNI